MLIRQAALEQIVAGTVDTVFRRQVRPTVKAGGHLRTRLGMLDILAVDEISLDDVTAQDARRSGAASVDEVIALLTAKPEGAFYRVRVRPGAVDPRVVLRESDALTDDELATVVAKLDGLDRRGHYGPWTRVVLAMIRDRPHVRAPDLAASIGRDTPSFKDDVRKLKQLGLTISHSPGYELSPRGKVVLAHLEAVSRSRSRRS